MVAPFYSLGHPMMEHLAAIGCPVDTLIHTHIHRDHTGWDVDWAHGVVNSTLRPTFHNVTYWMQRSEWAYWSSTEVGAPRAPG